MQATSHVRYILQTHFVTQSFARIISLSSENLKIKIRNTYSNFLCFYGCETRSVALREEHGIKVCENKEKMKEEEEEDRK